MRSIYMCVYIYIYYVYTCVIYLYKKTSVFKGLDQTAGVLMGKNMDQTWKTWTKHWTKSHQSLNDNSYKWCKKVVDFNAGFDDLSGDSIGKSWGVSKSWWFGGKNGNWLLETHSLAKSRRCFNGETNYFPLPSLIFQQVNPIFFYAETAASQSSKPVCCGETFFFYQQAERHGIRSEQDLELCIFAPYVFLERARRILPMPGRIGWLPRKGRCLMRWRHHEVCPLVMSK